MKYLFGLYVRRFIGIIITGMFTINLYEMAEWRGYAPADATYCICSILNFVAIFFLLLYVTKLTDLISIYYESRRNLKKVGRKL